MREITRVRDVLNAPHLRKIKLLAGGGGVERPINYVTVMEVPDIVDWLKGNDFIITSFYACKDDIDAQCRIVKDLAERGCAALAVKLGLYIMELDPRVLEVGEALNFPILQIHHSMSYIDVISGVMRLIQTEQREQKLREEFLKEILLNEHPNRAAIIQRGLLFGIELENRYFTAITIASVNPVPSTKEQVDLGKCASFAQIYPATKALVLGQVFSNHTYTLLLCDSETTTLLKAQQLLLERVTEEFKKVKHIRLSVGGAHFSIQGLQQSYFESHNALSSGRAFFTQDMLFFHDELELYGVLKDAFLSPSLYTMDALLKKIDNQDLMDTLLCYFDKNGTMDEVAAALFVHRNTVNYRLQRIYEITGLDIKKSRGHFILYNLALYYQLKGTKN